MRFLYSLSVLFVLCLVLGCSTEEDPAERALKMIPSEAPDTLQKLITAAPLQVLDLDAPPADTVRLSRDQTMGRPASPDSPDSPVLGRAGGMVAVEDSFYIADRDHQALLVMNKEGNILHKLGRRGSGPGEYKAIGMIIRNREYIFVADVKRAELQVFRPDYEYVTSIRNRSVGFWPNIAVNDSMLLMEAPIKDGINLIQSRNAYPPWEEGKSFFPQLIPEGYQPQTYNSYLVSMNNQGQIVVCYTGLPYLFLYDDQLNHTATIAMDSDHFSSLQNTPVIPKPSMQRAKMRWFFLSLDLQENGDIYFSTSHHLYRLSPSGEQTYKIADKVSFRHKGEAKAVSDYLMTDDYMYIVSAAMEYIYKVRLSEMQ
jgi:hypothetical protein